MTLLRVCKCGNEFFAKPSRVANGRGIYCSQACKYHFRVRPKGLYYNLRVVNKAWIKSGEQLSPETQFKPGMIPHNFKGDLVGYCALHDWVRRHAGNPKKCEHCGSTKKLNWANKSWEYKRDLNDWIQLCYWCHRKYDMSGAWGAASEKFPEIRR